MKRFFAVLDRINKIASLIGMQPIPRNQPKYALYGDRIVLILVSIGIVAFAALVVKVALMG